jgi:hypothetical protein
VSTWILVSVWPAGFASPALPPFSFIFLHLLLLTTSWWRTFDILLSLSQDESTKTRSETPSPAQCSVCTKVSSSRTCRDSAETTMSPLSHHTTRYHTCLSFVRTASTCHVSMVGPTRQLGSEKGPPPLAFVAGRRPVGPGEV